MVIVGDKMEAINRSLFLMLNAGDQPAPSSLWVAKLLAQHSTLLLPLLVIGLWLWGTRTARTAAVSAILCVALAMMANVIIGMFFMHPRPFMIPLGHSWMSHQAETSFPSDHATLFFAFGLGVFCSGLRGLGAVIVILGVAVGWARVYLGVHFPFDIVGALVVSIASAWGLVTLLAFRDIGTRLVDRLERAYRTLFALAIDKGYLRG